MVQDISENVYDISVFVWYSLNKLKLSEAADDEGKGESLSLGIVVGKNPRMLGLR